MTSHEVQTMRTILRHGGKVLVTMGRLTAPNAVRTTTVRRLADRGLVRGWTGIDRAAIDGYSAPSGRTLDIAVTAAGCLALAEIGDG